MIQFLPSPPPQASGGTSLASKYKKLSLVAEVDSKIIMTYKCTALEDHLLLAGLQIHCPSIRNNQTLIFKLIAQQDLVLATAQINVGSLGLKSWAEVTATTPFEGLNVTCALSCLRYTARLLHSEFTRNPVKVLSLRIGRVICMGDQPIFKKTPSL